MRHGVLASAAALAALVAVAAPAPVASPADATTKSRATTTGSVTATAGSAASSPSARGDGGRDPVAPHRVQRRSRQPQVSRDASRDPTSDSEPLSITIDRLSPSTMPSRGDIQVSGTVTNTDTAAWSTIKLYPTVSDEPMTTAAELAAATRSDADSYVGDRIVDDIHNATVDTLDPGQTADFALSVPRGLLGATAPGVYWFGIQALGQGPDGRIDGADGRARTFLPLVPQQSTGSLPLSVVLPLRRPIGYAADGTVSDPSGWLESLSKGGRLRSLVDLGASAGSAPVSWLVDPALVDAVRRLAAGNPARSLAANLTPGQGADPDASVPPNPGADASDDASVAVPDPSATASPGSQDDQGDDQTDGQGDQNTSVGGVDGQPRPLSPSQLARADASTRTVALAAQDWLARLNGAVRPGDELLVLPYGDTDVSAASNQDPRVYQVARARSDSATVVDQDRGVQVTPAVGAPSGYLDPTALDLLDPKTTTLVTDQAFREPPTTLVTSEAHDLVVASAAAVEGGPGPDDPRATTAMRQRLLAEAAVRFRGDPAQPLVTVLPNDWNPRDSTDFLSGLEAPWIELATVADATATTSRTAIDPTGLRYPESQASAELDAANFDAASRLMATGDALQNLLTLNTLVGGTVRDEALATTSYAARSHGDTNRVAADRATSWIDSRMRQVTVAAPAAVTLSSSTGRFDSTVTNRLDQPVTVALDARTDGRLRVTGPRRVTVAAGGVAAVRLGAKTDETGVHRVTLRVTDQRGVPLGSTTELSIRSSQVSRLIWLFLAIGAVLLFGTIAVRLFRRVRDARRGTPHPRPTSRAEPPAQHPTDPPAEPPAEHPAGAAHR